MGEMLDEVDVAVTPGLYRVTSESKSVYWIDREPRADDATRADAYVTRTRAPDSAEFHVVDGRWAFLSSLVALADGDPDPGNGVQSVLRVGADHVLWVEHHAGAWDSQQWIRPRTCTGIARIDVPLAARTDGEARTATPYRRVSPIALALYSAGVALDNTGAQSLIRSGLDFDAAEVFTPLSQLTPESPEVLLALSVYPNA